MFENWCRSVVVILGVIILSTECTVNVTKQSKNVVVSIRTSDENDVSCNSHLRKRQIDQQQPFSPQFFPFPVNPTQAGGDVPFGLQFGGPRSQDEEERFFAQQEQMATTLNPLAFINPPRTTLNPLEQQLLEEQQRFQQEIAEKGLREQQQLSLGVPRPPTPAPVPLPNANTATPFQFQDSPIQAPPAFPPLPSGPPLAAGNPRQLAPPQSFAFVRTYHPSQQRRRRKRAVDHRQAIANRVVVPSTRTYFGTLLQQPEPRRDLATISNWLIKQVAKQIQKSLDHLTESTPVNRFGSTTTSSPLYVASSSTRPSQVINLVTDLYPETVKPKQWRNSVSPLEGVSTTTQIPTTPSLYVIPQNEAGMISREILSVPYTVAPSNEIYQPSVRSSPKIGPVLYSRPQHQYYADVSKSVDSAQLVANRGIVYRVQPTAPVNPIAVTAVDETRPTRMQNVQVLGVASTPATADQQNFFLPQQYERNAFNGLKQIYEFDHQRNVDIESSTLDDNTSQRGTTLTSLFKQKLNDYKKVDTYIRKDETEPNRLAFQQPNRFFDLLQQSNTTEIPLTNNETFAFDTGAGNGSKAAIFIRVPNEEQTSTLGYIFDKAITAKSTYKKDYGSHKKYNRSPQVIKSSLVYRTPPGKKATASLSEFAPSNLITDEDKMIRNYFMNNGTPILGFWRGSKRSTTTSRPFMTALLNLVQKRNVPKER